MSSKIKITLTKPRIFQLMTTMLIVFVGVTANAKAICSSTSASTAQNIENLAEYLEENQDEIIERAIQPKNTLKADQLKPGQLIKTSGSEVLQVISDTPYPVKCLIMPNTSIQVVASPDKNCGIKLEIVESEKNIEASKISCSGNHPSDNQCVGLYTPSFEITAQGTRYSAEVNALNEALMASMAEVGEEFPPETTEENVSVQKGSIQVKLRRVTQKSQTIKVTKTTTTSSWKTSKTVSQKNSRKKVAKTKSENKKIAANDKIKLKAGSSIKAKRNKKAKTQVADIEVIDPSGM